MAIDLNTLLPEFRAPIETLIANCRLRGIEMRPHSGVRSPFDQGRLWRQSRATEEIAAKVGEFRAKGAHFLAHCIESVGPQHGDHVTNAPPGFSWHQWAEAVDCFWVVDGKAEWSTVKKVDGINGYRLFADEAESLGLTAGGHWAKFKDWPHIQMREASAPARILSLQDINDTMEARFGSS